MATSTEPRSAVRDFDFYMGSWRIHHRRLKERLADNDDWKSSRAHRSRGRSSVGPATSTTTSSTCPPARTGGLAPFFRPQHEPVVHLVARRPHAGPPRSASRRRVRERRRDVHRRRHVQRPADPGPLHLVGHHRQYVPLGAVVLAGRWDHLGGQLDHGVHPHRLIPCDRGPFPARLTLRGGAGPAGGA